jgi:hypothetical protein
MVSKIVEQMRDRGTNAKQWADAHGFSAEYLRALLRKERGKWRIGTAKKIYLALEADGYEL